MVRQHSRRGRQGSAVRLGTSRRPVDCPPRELLLCRYVVRMLLFSLFLVANVNILLFVAMLFCVYVASCLSSLSLYTSRCVLKTSWSSKIQCILSSINRDCPLDLLKYSVNEPMFCDKYLNHHNKAHLIIRQPALSNCMQCV